MFFFKHKKSPKELFSWFIYELIKTVFVTSLLTAVLFFILEYFKTGIITNYLNINLVLIICLIFGMITALLIREEIQLNSKKIGLFKITIFVIISIFSAFFVFNILNSAKIGYVLSLIVGLVIFLILIVIDN